MSQGDYFIDTERGIRWIIICKCASTTLDVVLGIGEDGKHRCSREEALKHDDLFTVVFVRDPWQRLVSAMYHPLDTGGTVWERLERHVWLPKPDDLNQHVQPMSWTTDGFRLDFVGNVDNMASGWKRLGGRFDLPPLTHENKSGRPAKGPIFDRLTDRQSRKFWDLYGEDLDLYQRAGTMFDRLWDGFVAMEARA
jgi:hypothetical protein